MGDLQEVVMEIRERVVKVETKSDAQNDLRERVCAVEEKATEIEQRSKSNIHRIDKLEANNTWLWRTVARAIISGMVGTLVIFN